MKLLSRIPNTLFVRMAMAFTVLFTATIFIITWTITTETARSQLEIYERIGENLIKLSRPVVRRMLAEQDMVNLKNYMKDLSDDPAIAAINIIDKHGNNIFTFQRDFEPANWLTRLMTTGVDRVHIISTGFKIAGKNLGQLNLTLSYNPLNKKVASTAMNSLVLLTIVLLITLTVAYFLLARFTRPLQPLTKLAQEYTRGNWLAKVDFIDSGTREIQELTKAFADGSSAMQHYIRSLEETRELLELSETRLRTLINNMHEVLFELDSEGRISFINPSWQTITGFSIDDSLGKMMVEFISNDGADIFSPENLPKIQKKNHELFINSADGDPVWVTLDADYQTDSDGNFTGVIGTLGDVTETVELNRMLTTYQKELYHLSVTDPLTGLFNRRHFDTHFDLILSEHLKNKDPLCLLFIDIDGFKFINDTYGHPFGDEVLKTIATLLQDLVRRNDYISRLAGDEFAMVLKNTGIKDATRIAYKLHDNITQTQIKLPVGHIQIQCSIGVAEAPTHGNSAQTLVSAADVALYQSKQAGRNRVLVLSQDTSKATMTIFSQGFRIRNALESGNILPAFQPICDLSTGDTIAYEVLARMKVDGEIIPAKEFIVVAEGLGLTREVDLYMIEQALVISPKNRSLFVNIDMSSFNDEYFVKRLSDLLRLACDAGRQITIEITERESVPINAELLKDIDSLRKMGCKLALDDFGSGYSTYKFLELFRPDYLKIEGTFVQSMLQNDYSNKIVRHINDLAHSFGMKTIAENIENAETLAAVKKLGIEHGQGMFLGKPDFLQ